MALDIAPLLPPTVEERPPAPPVAPEPEPEPKAEDKAAPERDPSEVLVERIDAIVFTLFAPPPATAGDSGKEPPDASAAQSPSDTPDASTTPTLPPLPTRADFIGEPGPPPPSPAPKPEPIAAPAAEDAAPPVFGVHNSVPALDAAIADPSSPLSKAAREALAGPLTWGRLDALTTAATAAAREYGWSLARAFPPVQEIGSGVLRLEIMPVTLEGVDVEGARWTKAKNLRRPFARLVGRIVNTGDFTAPGGFVAQNPLRRVTPALAPGKTAGTTRLRLNVADGRPYRVFGGFDVTNSRSSGLGRYTAGFTAVAPWRTEDIATFQYATDTGLDHLKSASFSYRMALPWMHYLTLTGLVADSKTDPTVHIHQHTRDYMAALSYSAPLAAAKGWTHEIGGGLEWRRSEYDYEFMGFRYFDNVVESAAFSLNYRVRRADRFGLSSLYMEGAASPGDWLGGHMDKASNRRQRGGTDAKWLVFRWDLRRDWRLPLGFALSNRFWGQLADSRLPEASRFFLGGNRTVRGYRDSEIAGDGGFGLSAELLSPAWKPSELPEAKRKGMDLLEIRLAAFWDWGQAWNKKQPQFGEFRRQTIAGAGLGLRVDCGGAFTGRLDYARRLRDTGIAYDDVDGYWHASAHFSF